MKGEKYKNRLEEIDIQLQILENSVIDMLKYEISKSDKYSKHIQGEKILEVEVFNYEELCNYEDNLIFIDSRGYQYFLFDECTIHDLIDILNQL